MRVEVPGKVNGTARYSIDLQVPNMLYGTVLRAPVEGWCRTRSTIPRPRRLPGSCGSCVCLMALGCSLRRRGGVRRPPGARAIRNLDERARRGALTAIKASIGSRPTPRTRPGCPLSGSRIGDPRGAMPKAVSTMEAEYRCDYAYHAQMEPLNAIASVSPAGDAVEIGLARKARPPPPKRRRSFSASRRTR